MTGSPVTAFGLYLRAPGVGDLGDNGAGVIERESLLRRCCCQGSDVKFVMTASNFASKPFDRSTGYRCQKIARQTATMKALSRKPDSFRQSKSQCSAAIRLLARNQAKRGFGIQPSTWQNASTIAEKCFEFIARVRHVAVGVNGSEKVREQCARTPSFS